MKNVHHYFFFFLLTISFFQCQPHTDEQISQVWPETESTTKPWTRWWWMGNAVNKKDIETQLKAFSEAGFGGVEITPIYGVKGYEDQYIDFLSDQWIDILQFTINKAGELGMGVDMNLGTGWPFGGPQITPEFAASTLIHEKYNFKNGVKVNEKIVVKDPKQNPEDVELLAITAYLSQGKTIDLMPHVNGEQELEWLPTEDCEVYAAFNGKTRQKVKRAAPGGEGWSLNHFSNEALQIYLARFDSAFSKISNRPRAFFNDSYEVYGSSGTRDIFTEFEKRRGYDLKPYLKELFANENSETARRVQSDYRQTLSDLLRDEFTIPWKDWTNGQGSKARNQAHGSPGNILDLYGTVDISETETFGSSYFPIPGLRRDSADIRPVDPDPVMMKFATSAANILGKDFSSSETFTWLAEHFRVSLSQCRPEVDQVFLSGVNHVFYHGTTYSPKDAPWPGWLFYASVQFGPVNSFWPHLNGLNAYISRCQSILQLGKADSDLLVYWPVYDVWDNVGRLDQQVSIHNIDEWLHPTAFYKHVTNLTEHGYLMDFASDHIIENLKVDLQKLSASQDGSSYKTLIIPSCELMPLATLKNILELASRGANIIFETLPKDVPGPHDQENRRKQFHELLESIPFETSGSNIKVAHMGQGRIIESADVEQALKSLKVRGEGLVLSGLQFVRRDVDGEKFYFLVNHSPKEIDSKIPFNTEVSTAILMDPNNGDFGKTKLENKDGHAYANIQLKPGQSIILRFLSKNTPAIPEWRYLGKTMETTEFDGSWHLSFTTGGPELPEAKTLDHLISWTELPDKLAVNFSGQAVYTYDFDLSEELANEYVLDLGKVAESARLWVNDNEVGVLWSLPFQARIGKYLKSGQNTIKIEVANLMANRIRYMDIQGLEWRKFREINFVNIDYKPFDASNWQPMQSGLLGPVVLKAMELE